MRTVMRAAAVAAVAVATVAGTAVAANAAPATSAASHYVTLSVPSSVKAHTVFYQTGKGYDSRTSTPELCLQGRVLYRGHWSSWQTILCDPRHSGRTAYFGGKAAAGGWPVGTYDLRLSLYSHPRAGVWKQLDYSAQHILNVHN
ncbi:hypothetical protein ABH931_002329 [Streptacidiphilus sp. MAP12-33]|uniref:hypothetical protein n=1 Tax=Streptacidiphilus sp. MAP12-33 TaxID=3156266 RepID=UPI003514AB5D